MTANKMTRDEARIYVKEQLESYLQSKGINTNKNFNCLNPDHADKNPSMSYDLERQKAHCFACAADYDTFDIIGIDYGLTDYGKIFEKAYDYYHIEVEGVSPASTQRPLAALPSGPVDYTEFFKKASSELQNSQEALTYLRGRGISPETAARFMLGYCPEWKSPAAIKQGSNPPPNRRLIIPTGKKGYTTRSIEPSTPEKYRFMKEGEAGYFNKKALYGTVPAFIVEAAFDALSVAEAGGEACALGSTSGVNKFLEMLDREPPTVPLILSLDMDEPGKEAQVKLKAGLEARKISFYEVNTSGEHKDPNEHLTANRAAFTAIVNSDPTEAAREEAEAEKGKYLATAAAYCLNDFMGEIAASADTPAISTGFGELDEVLDGGLYEGLIVIGAISSLGKTSYILQAADQIAQQGQDVLIFSLEMSKYELLAKSISRLTFNNCGGKTNIAKTTRGILSGAKRKYYSQEEKELINQSVATYSKYSEQIYIYEGIGTIGTEQIKQEVQRHISFTGNTPVVIIDYLQILAPFDMRATDKQNTDKAVLELKRLSRDKKIPVIAVSSFNRDNYIAPVNLASFKESGAIEYSSDILLGLQLAGMDKLPQGEGKRAETIKMIEEKKVADPRIAQLKILKNRNGKIGVSLFYEYYPMFNYFKETVNPEAPGVAARR